MRIKLTGPLFPEDEKPAKVSVFEGFLPYVGLKFPKGSQVYRNALSTEVKPIFYLKGSSLDAFSPIEVDIELSFREATLLADALTEQLKNYREIQVSRLAIKPKQL
jgi:hypothetical protein